MKTRKDDKSVFKTFKLIINTIIHMFLAAVFLFIVHFAIVHYSTNESLRLHVIFQTFGYLFIMMEAIMAFQADNSWSRLLSRKNKKIVHLGMQVTGCVFIIAGFAMAIVYKEYNGRPHFKSNHAILGLVAFIFSMISMINGFGTFLIPPSGVRSTGIKLFHIFTGVIAIIMGLVCIILGLNKPHFIQYTGDTLYIVASIFVSICAFYIIIKPLLNLRVHLNTMKNAT